MSAVLSLFLYLIQQAGVLMGAGAAALGLLRYLYDAHKHAPSHQRASRGVEGAGLALMALSGLGIVALEWSAGEFDVLFAPAFVFKWILIGALLVCVIARSRMQNAAAQAVLEGLTGGNWLALLLVHITAPVTTWPMLWLLYGGWAVFFGLAWSGCTLLARHEHTVHALPVALKRVMPAPAPRMPVVPSLAPTPAPVHILAAPAPRAAAVVAPKVSLVPEVAPTVLPEVFHPKAATPPAAIHPVIPAPAPVPHKMPVPAPRPAPVVNVDEGGMLPALRVMPRRPEDIGSESRGAVVSFS